MCTALWKIWKVLPDLGQQPLSKWLTQAHLGCVGVQQWLYTQVQGRLKWTAKQECGLHTSVCDILGVV